MTPAKSNKIISAFSILLAVFLSAACKKEDPKPRPDAEFTVQVGREGEVTFANTSTNAKTYKWTFGDGSTSISTSPSHVFQENGNFTVKLEATGEGGSTTVSEEVTIHDVGLTEMWLFKQLVITNCLNPGQNQSLLTCTSSCPVFDISLTHLTIDGMELAYTISGNSMTIQGVDADVTFLVSGNDLILTLQFHSTSSQPNCREVDTFERI